MSTAMCKCGHPLYEHLSAMECTECDCSAFYDVKLMRDDYLTDILAKIEAIVCTEGVDAGVILISDDSPTHPEVSEYNGVRRIVQVYDHQHFSPLGDALIDLYQSVKALTQPTQGVAPMGGPKTIQEAAPTNVDATFADYADDNSKSREAISPAVYRMAEAAFDNWWGNKGSMLSLKISVDVGHMTPQEYLREIFIDAWLEGYTDIRYVNPEVDSPVKPDFPK